MSGLNVVLDNNADDGYALQRSEILDSATCNYCFSTDSRVVDQDDPFARNTVFHSNCRGIWVDILRRRDPTSDRLHPAGLVTTIRYPSATWLLCWEGISFRIRSVIASAMQ